MAHREQRRSVLPLVLLATVVLAATSYAQGSPPPPSSSSEGQQIGKILSVRKVLRNQYFGNRYPQIHYKSSCRYRGTKIRYVRNITAPFPEDDNLFIHEIHELIAPIRLLTTAIISSNPSPKLRCSGEMHSSNDSGDLPDVHLRCRALGTNP